MLKDRFEDGDIGKIILLMDEPFVHNDYRWNFSSKVCQPNFSHKATVLQLCLLKIKILKVMKKDNKLVFKNTCSVLDIIAFQ